MTGKKEYIFLTIVFLTSFIVLTGCGIRELFVDEYEKMDKASDQVIQALDEKDSETFKALFCEKVVRDNKNIEQDIAAVMEAYEGKHETSERISYGSQSRFDKGKHSREIYAVYKVETAGGIYYLAFAYWPVNTIDPDMEGMYSIDVSTEEAFEGKYYMADTDFPGIHFQKEANEDGNVMLLYGNLRRYTYIERNIELDEAFFGEFIQRSQSYNELINEAGQPNGELSIREYVFELTGSAEEKRYAVCSLGAGDSIEKIEIVNEEEILRTLWEEQETSQEK